MTIIDIHTHVWPDALAPAAISTVGSQGHLGASYDGTVAGLVASMDAAGIDRSVVVPVSTKPSQVRTINDWAATIGSDRIVPFGSMHPDFEDPGAEIARLRSLGIGGFKMHPEYQAFEPLDPRMPPIYDAAVENGMVLFFHAGGDVAFDTVRGTPQQFVAVLERWPGLRIVLAHMGGFRQWPGVKEHLAGRDVWLDTAYTLGHLPDEEFVALVRAHGAGHVVFGTDGPWTDAVSQLEYMRSLPFSDSELTGILGGNAERLLATL